MMNTKKNLFPLFNFLFVKKLKLFKFEFMFIPKILIYIKKSLLKKEEIKLLNVR